VQREEKDVADAPKAKVVFLHNAVDEESKVNYWNGQEAELHPDTAARLEGAGLVEVVEEPEVEEEA
jgi:hypothetical protein